MRLANTWIPFIPILVQAIVGMVHAAPPAASTMNVARSGNTIPQGKYLHSCDIEKFFHERPSQLTLAS